MFQWYARFQAFTFDRLERFSRRQYWSAELALAVFLYAGFVAFPSFDIFSSEFAPAWEQMYRHAAHMLEPMAVPPESHEAKMTFRLFFPVLIKLVPLAPAGVLALKFLAGFATIWLFIRACQRWTDDRVLVLLLTLALACTHMPRCTFDISGKLDTFAFCFLLMPLAFRNAPAAFLGIFLAAWVDERALITSSLVFLGVLFDADARRWRSLAGILLGWGAYLGLRFYLSQAYQLSTPSEGVGLPVLKAQLSSAWLSAWGALEGLWLIVLSAFVFWIRDKQTSRALLTAGALGLVMLAGLSVMDISRSMAYTFPVVLVALPVWLKHETGIERRQVALLALLLSFAYPAYVIGDFNRVIWQLPMPLQLLRMGLP